MAIAAIGTALVLSLIFRASGLRIAYAFPLACAVVPIFVLVAEFVVLHQVGGASMWPVALFFGGTYGALVSGAGVVAGDFLTQRKSGD